jgi:outer membrane protein assembly factor BamB
MRSTLIQRGFAVSLALLFLATAAALAGNWPQWRGPQRDGVASLDHSGAWPEKLKQRWKVEVGEGHSSPIVVRDRVYLLARKGENEIASSLALESGKTIWQQSYAAPYEMSPVAQAHGKGPKSTSVIDQGRLYTFGISGVLSAFDAAGGKPLWRKDFSKQYKATSPAFGTAMSPAVAGGRVIAHVGGHAGGALTAFDAQSGEPVWSWSEDGPAYTSPIVITLGGVRQVVTQTEKQIVGVSFDSGKLLWRIPFTTPYDQNVVTPVVYKDTLIFSGHQQRTFAVRVAQNAGKWSAREIWTNDAVPMYMSSPVLSGDHLYGFTEKRKGSLFCLDARDGKVLWSDEGRQGDNASLVLAGGQLLVLTTGGELLVVPASPSGYKTAASYEVADTPTWAHLAVAGNRILVKDKTTLAAWSLE